MNNMYGTTDHDFFKEISKLTARKQSPSDQQPAPALKSIFWRLSQLRFWRQVQPTVTITIPRHARAKARG